MTEFYYFAHAHPVFTLLAIAMILGFIYETFKLLLNWAS